MSGTPDTSEQVLHRAEGSATTGSGLWFLIAFGMIGALTMTLVGFAVPSMVGPGWLWMLTIVPIVLLARWELRRSAIVIEVIERGAELRVRVSGKGATIDEPIRATYERWATSDRVPLKHGGGKMVHFSVVVMTERGRRLGFHQMGGRDAAGWPERSPRLSDGPDVFLTLGIFGFEKALASRARPRS
jgi:hypothetical protein